MKQYLNLMRHAREHGRFKQDRTGTGTYGVFGYQMRFDLADGFPLVTTKKCHLRSIIHELLWFLQGDTNIRYLKENGVSIWDEWVKEGTAEYVPLTREERYELYVKFHDKQYQKYWDAIARKPDEPLIQMYQPGAKPVSLKHMSNELLDAYDIPSRKLVAGELGPVYGAQWRSWPTGRNCPTCKGLGELDDAEAGDIMFNRWTCPKCKGERIETIDQIAKVVETLKTNPDSRRIIVSAWNPAQVDDMALPPCHALFQFYSEPLTVEERVAYLNRCTAQEERRYYKAREGFMITEQVSWRYFSKDSLYGWFDGKTPREEFSDEHRHKILDRLGVPQRRLSCQLYQRSADIFLGVPFNIASYALLVMMVAQVTGHAPGEFVWTGGDCHLYANHLEQVDLQLQREPHALPTMHLNPDVKDLFEFKFTDFTLEDYESHPHISAPVAV